MLQGELDQRHAALNGPRQGSFPGLIPMAKHRSFPESKVSSEIRKTTRAGAAFHNEFAGRGRASGPLFSFQPQHRGCESHRRGLLRATALSSRTCPGSTATNPKKIPNERLALGRARSLLWSGADIQPSSALGPLCRSKADIAGLWEQGL